MNKTKKKTIKVNLNIFKALLIGLGIGIISIFIVEHWSNFSYLADTSKLPPLPNNKVSFSRNIPLDTPVSFIQMTTPFDSEIRFPGKEYSVYDIHYSDGEFHSYENKLKYYWEGVITDIKYVFYAGISFSLISFIFLNYDIRFT